MSDEELRKLAGFIVDAIASRLGGSSGDAPGLTALLTQETEPEDPAQVRARDEAAEFATFLSEYERDGNG